MEPVRFLSPQLPPFSEVGEYFKLAEQERWFANRGPCHRLLTSRIEAWMGNGAQGVLVANGTLGLMVALRALLDERDHAAGHVIVPSFTFAATVNAVLWSGLTPVFVDVDPKTWHLAPDALERALQICEGKVVAAVPCSTFGTPPPVEQRRAWEHVCSAAGVALLVDSAAAFGARDEDGMRLGAQGDAELFSFHATKPFAIGEGGMIATSDDRLARKLVRLTNFGFDDTRVVSDSSLVGMNAKLSEIHAATGLAMLDTYDEVLIRRRNLADAIRSPLSKNGFIFQEGCERSTSQFVPALAPTVAVRERVLQLAARAAVELRTYFSPLHQFPAFRAYPRIGTLAVTEDLSARILSLPLANDLSQEAIDRIVEVGVSAARGGTRPSLSQA
jgi:dTDP-4-amino-4,6-dideoxygalactose transaminase